MIYINHKLFILDPNYRYKMPRLILKIEGKGNGIKTNLVNLNEVAKAIRINTESIYL
jgi:translation initiation factor 5